MATRTVRSFARPSTRGSRGTIPPRPTLVPAPSGVVRGSEPTDDKLPSVQEDKVEDTEAKAEETKGAELPQITNLIQFPQKEETAEPKPRSPRLRRGITGRGTTRARPVATPPPQQPLQLRLPQLPITQPVVAPPQSLLQQIVGQLRLHPVIAISGVALVGFLIWRFWPRG